MLGPPRQKDRHAAKRLPLMVVRGHGVDVDDFDLRSHHLGELERVRQLDQIGP